MHSISGTVTLKIMVCRNHPITAYLIYDKSSFVNNNRSKNIFI